MSTLPSSTGEPSAAEPSAPLQMEFQDNALLSQLCGPHDEHLARLEKRLGVTIVARGNRLTIAGAADGAEAARSALALLYDRLKQGREVDRAEVDAAARMALGAVEQSAPGDMRTRVADLAATELTIRTRKRIVAPRSPGQAGYLRALSDHELTFGLGPAGTGKTYLAVAWAVSLMNRGQVERIILSRPAVEAGERLGFLPGDLREKIDPYLRPLYDALYDLMPAEQVARGLENGEIEVAPLAFMRGRTLSNAFIIVDEAQNTTPMQMKMLLTRIGENSRMAVTGDLSQVDLPRGVPSGLRDAVTLLDGVDGIGFANFSHADVVRHELVSRIVQAYDARDGAQAELALDARAAAAAGGGEGGAG